LVDDVLVEHGLLAGQPGPRHLLDLVREVGHERAVGLAATQDERLGEPPEPRCRLAVAAALDRLAVPVAELFPAAQQARVDRVEDRPQLGEAVLDRRAGEGELLAGRQPAGRPRRVSGRVLDHLGLVEHDRRPVDRGEVVEVAGQ
jgi:hypothetical protein